MKINKLENNLPNIENNIAIDMKIINNWYSFNSGFMIDIEEYMFAGKKNIAIIPAHSPESNVDIVSFFKSDV